MSRKKGIMAFAAAIFILISIVPTCSAQTALTPTQGNFDLGIVFNTGDILLGLESYQAGFGVKLGTGKLAYRGLADFTFSGTSVPDSPTSFSIVAGVAVEYHFIQAAVSPYIGAAASAGYLKLADTATSIPLSAGAILGIEVFPFEFLSAFVEYTLAVDVSIVTDTATATTTTDYLFDARMGNNARIGIVFYFMRLKHK